MTISPAAHCSGDSTGIGVDADRSAGPAAGTTARYGWGLSSPPQGDRCFDTRAVGVASNLLAGGMDTLPVFAGNTWTQFSNAAVGERDVLIDVDGGGHSNCALSSGDRGYWTTRTFDGTVIDLLLDVAIGTVTPLFLADAPRPALASAATDDVARSAAASDSTDGAAMRG